MQASSLFAYTKKSNSSSSCPPPPPPSPAASIPSPPLVQQCAIQNKYPYMKITLTKSKKYTHTCTPPLSRNATQIPPPPNPPFKNGKPLHSPMCVNTSTESDLSYSKTNTGELSTRKDTQHGSMLSHVIWKRSYDTALFWGNQKNYAASRLPERKKAVTDYRLLSSSSSSGGAIARTTHLAKIVNTRLGKTIVGGVGKKKFPTGHKLSTFLISQSQRSPSMSP